jgi:phosphoribosylglycinamide formyltransferase-1
MEQTVISVLASGRGSNFMAVAAAVQAGEIKARFGALVSDRADAPALEHAAGLGMTARHLAPKDFADREAHERRIIEIFESHGTGLVLAAGYMRLLTPLIVRHYRHRIINIHPALLPAFPGIHAQRRRWSTVSKSAAVRCTLSMREPTPGRLLCSEQCRFWTAIPRIR